MAHAVIATVPGLVSGGAARFDARFYLLFWALELPDLHPKFAPGSDPYAKFNADLTAALRAAKSRVVTQVAQMKESERDRGGAHSGYGTYGRGLPTTAHEKPIVTQVCPVGPVCPVCPVCPVRAVLSPGV